MTRNLVRVRAQINSMYNMRAQLNAISLQLSSLQMTAQMMESFGAVNTVMEACNKSMDIKSVTNMVKEFSKEHEKFGMK